MIALFNKVTHNITFQTCQCTFCHSLEHLQHSHLRAQFHLPAELLGSSHNDFPVSLPWGPACEFCEKRSIYCRISLRPRLSIPLEPSPLSLLTPPTLPPLTLPPPPPWEAGPSNSYLSLILRLVKGNIFLKELSAYSVCLFDCLPNDI